MTLEEEFHEELLSLYRRTGEVTGYWPNYFNRDVKNRGGLAVAKRLLSPGQASSGFGRLVEVRRADLSLEYIALSDRFAPLFTQAELHEASNRLAEIPRSAFPSELPVSASSPQEVEGVQDYTEGAVVSVKVNRFERSGKARDACVAKHGSRCAVCDFDFAERYGEVGKGFIHVHHKRPLAKLKVTYRLDPEKDLVPVCPNCHAMLHRREPPLDVEQLRRLLR
jgi:5-methylcytosine-specific restriction protein A